VSATADPSPTAGVDVVTAGAAAVRGALSVPPGGRDALTLWASTPGGCEPEAAAELAALGWRRADVAVAASQPSGEAAGLTWERGAVYGVCDLAGVEATLRTSRTLTRLSWLLASAEVGGLDDVAAAVREAPLALPDAPFAVVAERHGEHPFRSPDVAREAGAAVIETHRARTGRRLPVDLDDPATVVRVQLNDDRLRVGCELTAGSRYRRTDLPRRHRAGLNAVIAACLVVQSGWADREHLLDPMCGAATIPVEAARAALRRPPPVQAADRLDTLGLRDTPTAAATEAAVAAAAIPAAPPITGLDHHPGSLEAARTNLEVAGLADAVALRHGDARDPPSLDDVGEIDAVVANPPYGVRVGRDRELAALYDAVLAALARRLAPGGRVVWLTPAHGVATRAAIAAGLVPEGRRSIGLGTFDATACRFARPRA
jgi:tRNA (guanine6-N2)-methyltransferase